MTSYEPTPETTLHRIPARGTYDRDVVHAILDEGLVCHLGFVADGQPFVIPTNFAREGETLYVHGAAASRTLRALSGPSPVCLTVTLLDGLVMARSAFHHSMNYRSVVVLGLAHQVTEKEDKLRALELFVEKLSPGRSRHVRAPNDKELRATSVLAMSLVQVSAKVRTGGPKDDDEDMSLDVWAGHVPLALRSANGIAEPEITHAQILPTLPRFLGNSAAK